MIRKQDILERAAEWQLRAEIVEKDYVLGWLLAGLGRTSVRDLWIVYSPGRAAIDARR